MTLDSLAETLRDRIKVRQVWDLPNRTHQSGYYSLTSQERYHDSHFGYAQCKTLSASHSPSTIHHSPFTIHHPPTTHHSPFTLH